jgi:hypothetical protein
MMIWMKLLLLMMKNMELSLKSSLRSQTDFAMNFAWFLSTSVCVTNVPQAPPYGPPYGRRLHTVHTVGHTATLKTAQDIPDFVQRTQQCGHLHLPRSCFGQGNEFQLYEARSPFRFYINPDIRQTNYRNRLQRIPP